MLRAALSIMWKYKAYKILHAGRVCYSTLRMLVRCANTQDDVRLRIQYCNTAKCASERFLIGPPIVIQTTCSNFHKHAWNIGHAYVSLRAIIDSLGSTAQHLLHSAIANFVSVCTCLWCGVQCVLPYVVFMDYDIRPNALCSLESCVCDV